MKRYVGLILFTLFFFLTCEKDDNEYYTIPDKYKNILEENDTLIYKMPDLGTDTFVVTRKVLGYYRLALSGTSCKKPWAFFEVQSIFLDRISKNGNNRCYESSKNIHYFGDCGGGFNCHSLINFEVGMRNIRRKDNRDFSPTIFWNDKSIRNYTYNKTDTIINNLHYDNVLIYKPTDIDSLKTVIFSHKIGIITIELKEGYSIMFQKRI